MAQTLEKTRKRRLTKKQKDWADEYLEHGNGTLAAQRAYDVKGKSAHHIAYENHRKPQVIEYFIEKSEDMKHELLKLAVSAESESVKLSAIKDILDRAGFSAVKKTDITKRVEHLNHEKAELLNIYQSLYGEIQDAEVIEHEQGENDK